MPDYVLLREEKGSDLSPAEADANLQALYNNKAEKTAVQAIDDRATVLETSQVAQDAELGSLDDRIDTLESTQAAQDNALATHEARLDDGEARLAELTDKSSRDKGVFDTPDALRAAHPAAIDGDHAIVKSTDTQWIWGDGDWKDTDTKGQVASVNGKGGDVVLTAADVGAAASSTVQIFEDNGTYLKPAGAVSVEFILISGGNGGSSGQVSDPGVVAKGGNGGAGGAITRMKLPASMVNDSCAVVVGKGGKGADASSGNSVAGSPGGSSAFHAGPGSAPPYRVTAGLGTDGGVGELHGGRSTIANASGYNGSGAVHISAYAGVSVVAKGAPAGASGGGITAIDAESRGGGSTDPFLRDSSGSNNSDWGVAGGGHGADGLDFLLPGGGSSGGGSNISGNGGDGGNGGKYGAGGSGGGAARTGFLSGKGGDGAPGVVIVITHF
ncbi:hypothetical protein [Lysobacter sp. GCM10012299]|uniref:glycine-rich domain-containing protein n=1 Tax=Lysobacter sp. GCM10012299 TaxID=3317333 RepID=UPI00361ACE18